MKTRKAASKVGIFPEFVKHSGGRVQKWLPDLLSSIMNTLKLPRLYLNHLWRDSNFGAS